MAGKAHPRDEGGKDVKGPLRGEQVAVAGRPYRVTGHAVFPASVSGLIPTLIGGNGQRLLTLAAREADIVGLSGIIFRSGGPYPTSRDGDWRRQWPH
jgi:alkanesulfonate monooxygenase SsuD/methylene tetrahydromethanopterin reductase-like flavin-dependent oxidoreductase (luciferase family)